MLLFVTYLLKFPCSGSKSFLSFTYAIIVTEHSNKITQENFLFNKTYQSLSYSNKLHLENSEFLLFHTDVYRFPKAQNTTELLFFYEWL